MVSSARWLSGPWAALGRSSRRARASLVVVALAFVASLLLVGPRPRAALAQGSGDLDVSAQVSAREVEVGEAFSIQLKALSVQSDAQPSDPDLRAPSGLVVSGPQISSQSFMQFGAGGSVVKTGIGATWQVVASAPGSYSIPGPSVLWKGKRIRASKLSVEVVPATGRARRPQNPFLLPGGPGGIFNMPWPFGGPSEPAEEEDDDDPDASSNRELAMPKAPDPNLFLRAIVDKNAAVVGEQVTLSFYIYHRVDFEMTERREAPLSDFVRAPLLKNPGIDPPVIAVAGSKRYAVRLLDKIAIFPVRAGELHTGSMSARFAGRRVGSRVLKLSNDLVIKVTEPPAEGRPAGYVLGDVGQFSMTASVQPRRVEQGGSVAVQVRLQGTGNFPQALRVPERTGLEWSDPEKRESLEPVTGRISGWRSFGYVVRVKEAGKVNLGDIELAFWDPVAKRYDVAKASLGELEVKASAPAPSGSGQPIAGPGDGEEKADPFVTLPGARAALGAYVPPGAPLLEGARLWWLLAAPPGLFALFVVGSGAARAFARKRESERTSPATLTERALRDAEQAEAKGDAKELAGALERALHNAVEHATGLKARGVLLRDLASELTARGLDAELAGRVHEVLSACETIRFDPGATPKAIRELRDRAQALARDLARRKAA